MKRALLSGIAGQDGSYLAEYLLDLGYEVHGIIRRQSVAEHQESRIDAIADRVTTYYGDLTDVGSLRRIVEAVMPDEVYNLAAMSHVRISFDIPEYTLAVNAIGALNMIEACRQIVPGCHYYQASSSEMFGTSVDDDGFQRETTPLCPTSPYGIAKVSAFNTVRHYRRAYGMFATNGILFNHSCVTAETPVIIRRDRVIDIRPIEEVVTHREDPKKGSVYTTDMNGRRLEVWDRDKWTLVTCATARWARREVVQLRSRSSSVTITPDHVVFRLDGKDAASYVECAAESVAIGDHLALSSVAPPPGRTVLLEEEAWFLGAMAADGYFTEDGTHGRFVKGDKQFVKEVADVWERISGGQARRHLMRDKAERRKKLFAAELNGASLRCRLYRQELYTERGLKRVPLRVLNADADTQRAFLRGYNRGDGLKAGHCFYEFKSFKTNSPTLAAGLWWMARGVLGQRMILCVEDREDFTYYGINLNSSNTVGGKGAHLRRPLTEVVRNRRLPYEGWVFDLATESGTFHAGVGDSWIHNSPRRGSNFVEAKIVKGAVMIKRGLLDKLALGNLDASRDWGASPDYVRAMHRMLQQPEPGDWVVATGETRTVRELCAYVFTRLGIDYRNHVTQDPRFLRPQELPYLRGDSSKIRALGWKPNYTFESLLDEIINYWLDRIPAR